MSGKISKKDFKFLKDLKKNNYREWFNDHKDTYQESFENIQAFAKVLLAKMGQHDQLVPMTPKQSLHRIYRDTRFSKDKTPYKSHWGGSLKRDTKLLRGGYYYHIEPGNTFVAGGFWGPSSADLKRIRKEFEMDDTYIRKIIAAPNFQRYFGELLGDGVKTAPKGFSKEHPAIDLIRKKQFIVKHDFTDKQVLSADFTDQMVEVFKAMHPYFNYMSEVLTTDLNGVSLV